MQERAYFFFLILFFVACAPSVPKIKRVTELAPPHGVAVADDSTTAKVRLTWKPSSSQHDPNFAGYNIYFSKRSLIMKPMKELPAPIFVSKQDTTIVLQNLEPGARYFIHVRSRLRNENLSLPSLPEVTAMIH